MTRRNNAIRSHNLFTQFATNNLNLAKKNKSGVNRQDFVVDVVRYFYNISFLLFLDETSDHFARVFVAGIFGYGSHGHEIFPAILLRIVLILCPS